MKIDDAINDAVYYFMENPSNAYASGLPSQTDVRLVLNDIVGEEGYGRASQSASVKKVMAKLKKFSKNLLMENPKATDGMTPRQKLQYYVSGAIKRGETKAIAGMPMMTMKRRRRSLMRNAMPTQQEYEMRSMKEFREQMQATEKLSLIERKENSVEWFNDCKNNPALVAERVRWLLAGNYGRGSGVQACRVAQSPRMNRVAYMAITIANLEWRCPARFAVIAYKKLSKMEQDNINALILAEIKNSIMVDGSCDSQGLRE